MSEVDTLDRYADRRRHFRRSVHRTAELTLQTGRQVYDCTVIDESDGGVQVDLGAEITLPDEVVIRFSDEASQLVRRCWSVGSKVGYQFVEPATAEVLRIRDVPPLARATAAVGVGEYACITPAALGLDRVAMDFMYSGARIHALLKDVLARDAAAIGMRGDVLTAAAFFGPKWRVFSQ
jgi:hypothetical protein